MRRLRCLCTKLIKSYDPFPMKRLGGNSEHERQLSPDKQLRAALLRSRYADVIVKAHGILSQVFELVRVTFSADFSEIICC
jgi:hypothetical protein